MDIKRVESSSVPLNTSPSLPESSPEVMESPTEYQVGGPHTLHEYGPFPGEVAYPPQSYLGPGQSFPQLGSEYPYVFYLPMDMVHENFAKKVEDLTKVNVDIDSTDGMPLYPRTFTEVETTVEEADDYEYRYPYPFPYQAYPYGLGAGYGYPRPIGYGYGYGYPRPLVGGYVGPVGVGAFTPFVW